MLEPSWLLTARSHVGTKETPGPGNNPKIMGWANRVGAKVLGIPYAGDHVPWCGLGVAACMTQAGVKPPAIAIRAKSWAAWGVAVKPCLGSVLVFDRKCGGHVGFYVGQDTGSPSASTPEGRQPAYHVLGYNQSDGVNVMRLAQSRCIASRWPVQVPSVALPVYLTAKGVPASSNEA